MVKFNELKSLYEDGYRCIYHDCNNKNYTIYLKNFDNENSQTLDIDENEFSEFQNYMNDLRMS